MENLSDNKLFHKKQMIAGRVLLAIICFLILVFIDQLTKYLVISNMNLYDTIPVIDHILSFHYIQNPGAAWGIFENKQVFFYICTILVLVFGIMFYLRCLTLEKYYDIQGLIVLVLAGAIGNFIDRIRFQYVIDFLCVEFIDFPIFNVADCYITIGLIFFFFILLFKYKEEDLEYLIQFKR